MNHKLRVTVRLDTDPGHVTIEVAGCLTRANYPALLHIMRKAQGLAPGPSISLDLYRASHLDLEVLQYLRDMADRDPGVTAGQEADDPLLVPEAFRLGLVEPAELPVCLVHAGMNGERRAGLDGEIFAERDLSFYLEGTLDPATTVSAMTDKELADLTDALYRHLDTRRPVFGAHTWYDFAADELHKRHQGEPDGPPQDELAAG